MRSRSVLCFAIYIGIVASVDGVDVTRESRTLSDVDPLLEAVHLEQWEDEETPCLEATLSMLYGVKNSTLWATWIWDSMQRPTGFLYGSRYQLGSFDQCMKPPWLSSHQHLRTQYCLADIHLTHTKPKKPTYSIDPYSQTSRYYDATSKHGRYFNVLTWGVCLPSECSQRSVRKLVQAMLRTQHLSPLTPDPYIIVDSCQVAGYHLEYSSEFYAFLLRLAKALKNEKTTTSSENIHSHRKDPARNSIGFLMFSLTILSISATVLTASGYVSTETLGNRLVKSFDLRKNWHSFIGSQGDEIRTLNGMKCISTGIIIVSHYVFFMNKSAVINVLDVERDLNTTLGTSIVRIDIVLETFIFISGLLLMKGLMNGKQRNPLTSLVKRYIRIVCPLAIMVFYFAAVHKYIGSGPLWPRFSSEQQELCRRNWWINFLMLPNYIRQTEICHIVTWYISCDIQLATAGIILFYVFQKNRKLGLLLFSISVTVSTLIPALMTYRKNIPAIIIYDIQETLDLTGNVVLGEVYMKTHCRTAVYLLGMLMGYGMSVYKPEDYRNVICMKWSMFAAAISFYLMHLVMREGGLFLHKDYNSIEAASYVAIDKIYWSIAIGCLIVVCEYGYLPIANSILWIKLWGTLSKLSYTNYIFHTALIFSHVHSVRTPMYHQFVEMISNGIGVVFSILPISLYLYIFVEAPAGNVANCIFETKREYKTAEQLKRQFHRKQNIKTEI